MALPYDDPSLPDAVAPIFQDNNFVTGLQLRSNNQSIWGNLEYLNEDAVGSQFIVGASQSLVPGTVVSFVKNTVIAGTGSATLESSVTWSNNSTLNAGGSPISAVKLTDTTFFVAYSDATTSGNGKGVVGSITNGVVSFGTPVTFESGGQASAISCVAINSTKIAISYRDHADSNNGKFIAATISGTTPTFGSEQTFAAVSIDFTAMTLVATDKIVIAYETNPSGIEGVVRCGTISGTVATFGTAVAYNSNNVSVNPSICRIRDNAVFICFSYTAINCTCGVVVNISGTVVTPRAIEILSFVPSSSNLTACCAVSKDQVVVSYAGQTTLQTDNILFTQVVKIYSGGIGTSEMMIGKPLQTGVGTSAITSLSMATLKDNTVYVSYQSSGTGVGFIAVLSGSDIRGDSFLTFEASAMSSASVISLSSELVVNFYTDQGNSNRGTATPVNLGQYLGICQSTGTDGDTVTVALEGVSNVHSGLIPGAFYYSDSSGILSTEIGQPVGMALSATEIFMDARAVTGFFFELCGNGAMWRANQKTGNGGTDLMIPYYTTVTNSSLSVYATIVNQNTNGCRITINQKGIYTVNVFCTTPITTPDGLGITLNDAALNTVMTSVSGATVLAAVSTQPISGGADQIGCSWTGILNVGDIIRPHDNGLTPVAPTRAGFGISLIQRLS